ncbi:hypothetical protein J3L16_13790 [Alteromonas sp. 5E99-2]|uniref:COG4648 family protein n=1 Tax=Alteromonas sp. 5E99-2 TaxID=2817683 RepID=UPI001A99B0C1|nr:hypothetical protein [Alteromonas sp. 5E99-2]MBO1256760.1 hypothetical protein [Alteromonas sp. 5E99-2]
MPPAPKEPIKAVLTLMGVIVMLAYPFLVYRYIDVIRPQWFAAIIFTLFLARFGFAGKSRTGSDWIMLAGVSLFCISLLIFESEYLLKLYPVLMNLAMSFAFFLSLAGKECLIETFAKLGGKVPPPEAHQYLRVLCFLWGVVLIINAAASAYTTWYASLSVWALYNGVLSYVLIASFAGGEWVYRGYYKKKHNIVDE